MSNINLHRVEKRYTVSSVDELIAALKKLGFKKKEFSDKPITLTYFCDTPNFTLPKQERVKIRTYTTSIPEKIDKAAPYKLNFKVHLEKSVSKKESFEGAYDESIVLAKEKISDDIRPMMAMSYKRSHYTLPENSDIRVTFDEDIHFHRMDGETLSEFYEYKTILLELKYNPESTESLETAEKLLSLLDYKDSESKKITMYRVYHETFGE